MRIKNFRGARAVPGFGVLKTNEIIEVSDEAGAKLARIPGFGIVDGDPIEDDEVQVWECDEHGKTYKTQKGFDDHMETYHGDD